MVTRKPISWFLTDQGRTCTFAVVTGTTLALTVAKFAPHTFLLSKYKEYIHYYRNGQPVNLCKELQDRCEKCLDVLKFADVHRKLISPFSVYGFDLFHAGSTASKFGVAVGIPVNFTYKSLADVEQADILVNQKKVNWESEAGKKLAGALILPDKVQEFAICREILMTKNYKVMYEATYPFLSIFFCYNLGCYLNRRLNLYAAPTMVRGTLYSILGFFGCGLYFLMKDVTEVHHETQVDKKLTEIDPEFIECGVIFYDKLLQRNQALRELMGKEGENKYSSKGNENFVLRHPRLALVHRKQYFAEKLRELKQRDCEEIDKME